MRYSEIKPGMFIVRTKELPWARVLSGVILYVHGFQEDGIVIRPTEDCVPLDKYMAIDKNGDDGNWYDVSDLVTEANSAITPPANVIAYKSAIAASYRNFLGLTDIPVVAGDGACGQICLLGEPGQNGTVFSKSGYYIIAHSNGWYIAYQGFCDYVAGGGEPQTTLRVLRLGDTRRLYLAKPVIDACSAAFGEDIGLAEQYAAVIAKETETEKEDTSMFDKFEKTDVQRMDLNSYGSF